LRVGASLTFSGPIGKEANGTHALLTDAHPAQATLALPFRLNNSSAHSPVALTLTLQHFGQLS